MIIKKQRKTKYPFGTMVVGERFLCRVIDYNSMLTSLRQYNKRKDLSITIEAEKTGKESLLSIIRLS